MSPMFPSKNYMVQQVAKSANITNSELSWNLDPISEYYAA